MAVAAFWIALAAVLIAGSWRKKSIEQMRHETVRQLMQQGSDVDADTLKELLDPPKPPPLPANHPWLRQPVPGQTYRGLRGVGTVLMVASVGIGALVGGVATSQGNELAFLAGAGVGVFFLTLGAGLFLSSRFAPRPRDEARARED